MSEWSKEPDLRPGGVNRVGSNPTSCKSPGIWDKYTTFSYSVVVITWDFESQNFGSNPDRRKNIVYIVMKLYKNIFDPVSSVGRAPVS